MRPDLARALAGAYLAGAWTRPGLTTSGAAVLGRRPRWLAALAQQVLEVFPAPPADRPRELAAVVASRPAAERAGPARPRTWRATATRMVRNPWHLPALHDLGDVAALLGLTDGELAWFADPKHWARVAPAGPLQHYRTSTRPTAVGGVRVLEAPKPRLKALQRRLLAEVLDGLPRSEAAHGRAGRSVATHAAPHAGRPVVVRLDLESFYAAVPVGRVYGLLRTAGYPEPVAHCLAGLGTTVLPRAVWRAVPRPADDGLLAAHWRLGRRLAAPHLPTGAPTSPALADLAAYRLDGRLTGLVQAWGGRYTRYADDLALSGAFGAGLPRLLGAVEAVVREEGFRLHPRKTAVMRRGGRQVLGGLVVNERPHVGRAEVDALRAVLHNCARYGPSTQDREGHPDFRAHLVGRVGWVAQHDPVRGARLRAQLDAVDWSR